MSALETINNDSSKILEQVIMHGDLSRLSSVDRMRYYSQVCDSIGLNPLTKPFDYITLQGKMTLYARKDCTEQLRKIRGISIEIKAREDIEGVYIVTAKATDKDRRVDESIGAVSISGLKGEAKANAIMKAETKAKRRVTLSISGLGMLDETEADTVPGAVLGGLDGTPTAEHKANDFKQRAILPETYKTLIGLLAEKEISQDKVDEIWRPKGLNALNEIAEDYAQKVIDRLNTLELGGQNGE